MRNSRQRKIIETVLKELPEHVTAIEVHRNARVFDETISLATVYRNLRLMVEWEGILRKFSYQTEIFVTIR